MDLVDGEHGCRRVVDGRRERLQRDVGDDPEREQRILLHRPLGAERDRRLQHAVVDRGGAAVEDEQRLVGRDEITDLGHEFDHPVGPLRLAHQRVQIDGEHDLGVTGVMNDSRALQAALRAWRPHRARRRPDSDRPT